MLLESLLIISVSLLTSSEKLKPAVIQVTKPIDHAEGPVWDYRTKTLYYVDIHAGGLYGYHVESDDLRHINYDGTVSVVIPTKSSESHFMIGLNLSLVEVQWDGKSKLENSRILSTVSKEFPRSRFNDGKADTRGRLWFGTMGYEDRQGNLEPNQGSLYKFTRTNLEHPDVMISPVNISNGLAWNKANDKFFYIDTPTNQVRQYNYNDTTGTISDPKVVFDVPDHPEITGHPDGMTIDAEDNLWVALYNGGAVVKVNPKTKELLQIVPLPAQYVTSVAWGDIDYTTLFVTTSRYPLDDEGRRQQPAAGSVFAVLNTGTHGYAPNFADIISIGSKKNKKGH